MPPSKAVTSKAVTTTCNNRHSLRKAKSHAIGDSVDEHGHTINNNNNSIDIESENEYGDGSCFDTSQEKLPTQLERDGYQTIDECKLLSQNSGGHQMKLVPSMLKLDLAKLNTPQKGDSHLRGLHRKDPSPYKLEEVKIDAASQLQSNTDTMTTQANGNAKAMQSSQGSMS